MRKSSTFLRVIRSYSGFEKLLSIVLTVVLILGSAYYGYGLISGGTAGAKEGIYTEGFQNSLMKLNPVYADLNEPDRDVSKLIFRGLTKYAPEAEKIVGDMADVNISEDKLTYTFTLKDNIKWHDGELLTSDDVYFTYHDVIQNPEFQNPILKANFDGVEITKIDNKTISFTLTAPNSFFITNTTVGVLPEHILRDVPVSDLYSHDFNASPTGTGSYKIKSPLSTTNKGVTQVVLERFDEYYGNLPQIKQMRFFGYPSRMELVDNRSSLNALPKVTDEAIDAISEDARFSMYGYSLPQYNAVFMNMDNPQLKSLKIRQALQKAIFKDAFLEQLPNTIRVETPVLSLDQDEYRHTASMDEAKKLLDNAGFKEVEVDETSDDEESEPIEEIASVESDDTDDSGEERDTAEEETTTEDSAPVEESGATEDSAIVEEVEPEINVIRQNAGGTVLEFRLIARLYPENTYKYTETETVLNYLQQNWAKAGVKLNIELYDAATLQEKIRTRDYDMLLFGQGLGYNLDLYGYWHSTQATETGLNLSNYKSFQVDTLIEGIRDTFDEDEKTEKLEELAAVIQNDIPAIFLYRPVYYYASDNKVKGIELEDMAFPADRFCRVADWSF